MSHETDCAKLKTAVWQALSTQQKHLTLCDGGAIRLQPGYPPMAAFSDPKRPDWAGLQRLCRPGDELFVTGLEDAPAAPWTLVEQTSAHLMLWPASHRHDLEGQDGFRLLQASDADQVMRLAKAAQLLPFGEKSLEMGEFVGAFEGERLVSMCGRRLRFGTWCEAASLCTDPQATGKGYATKLVGWTAHRMQQQGLGLFAHVMADNSHAMGIYKRRGANFIGQVSVSVVRLN